MENIQRKRFIIQNRILSRDACGEVDSDEEQMLVEN
jgi:hypothetical protein